MRGGMRAAPLLARDAHEDEHFCGMGKYRQTDNKSYGKEPFACSVGYVYVAGEYNG